MMKIRLKFMAALAALIIMAACFPALTAKAVEEGSLFPDEVPMFNASIEYSFEGYVVKGTFTEFTSDIIHIQPLYSLDGEIWQACGTEWDLRRLGTEDPNELAKLQNQICLYDSFEPLKSYLAGSLDCFYLKLSLIRDNGITYETQVAVIDRGTTQSVPEEITFAAAFDSSMAFFERNPFRYYGRYELTVNADATPEDISALLPDVLPIEVQLLKDNNFIAKGIVDCPVTWKPLSFPRLTAGESVIIPDVAEELVVLAGTLVSTPIGVFRLEEDLRVEQDTIITDEVRLVLNVIAAGEEPAEELPDENSGGAGGNEGNAGSDNKQDSTAEGQRPKLPQMPQDKQEKQQVNPPQALNPENQPEVNPSDLSQNVENKLEIPQQEGALLGMEDGRDIGQGKQGTAGAAGSETALQLPTAETVADICVFKVTVRMRANIISGRIIPQFVRILKGKLYNKFSTPA